MTKKKIELYKQFSIFLFTFILMSVAEDMYTCTHKQCNVYTSPYLLEFRAYGTPEYPPISWPRRPF